MAGSRFIAPLFISGPPTRRRSAAPGLICLHLERSRAPKSFLALRTPLSISSTKRVFLHQKEDGAHYGIPLLLSALKYRSLCVTVGGGVDVTPTPPTHTHTPHPALCKDCRLLVLATPRVQPTRQLTLYFPISRLPPRPSLFPFSIYPSLSLHTKQALSQHRKKMQMGKIAALII